LCGGDQRAWFRWLLPTHQISIQDPKPSVGKENRMPEFDANPAIQLALMNDGF